MENSIYVGKYLPDMVKRFRPEMIKKSYVDLPESEIVILSEYIGLDINTNIEKRDKRITLVVRDGKFNEEGFWPCICKMDKEEAARLRDALSKILEYDGDDQIQERI